MRISILTLFPRMIEPLAQTSIVKNAIAKGLVRIDVVDFREFSVDRHKKVDDAVFGGGPGMLLALDPIVRCLRHTRTPGSKVYLLSPEGERFDQGVAARLAKETTHLILVAGHYEGFDHRLHGYADGAISVGDYVLTGGEIPAMAVTDATVRLIPGVISADSLTHESFEANLLDHPAYTKPAVYDGRAVPEVLLSGNHRAIKEFNEAERIRITKQKRPDMYAKYLKAKKGTNNE